MLGLRNFGCKLNSQIEEGPRCFEPHHLTPRGSMDPFEVFFGPYAVGILPNWSRYVVARLSECPTGGAAIFPIGPQEMNLQNAGMNTCY